MVYENFSLPHSLKSFFSMSNNQESGQSQYQTIKETIENISKYLSDKIIYVER